MAGLLPRSPSYDECYQTFRWQVPEHFNIASAVCDRHATAQPDSVAIIFETEDGQTEQMRFGQLQSEANRLANVLRHHGVGPGDRVAIHLPQSFAAAVSHTAAYKLGAIALPLFSLFGPDALRHRLIDSASKVLVTCADNLAVLDGIRDELGDLQHVLVTDAASDSGLDARQLMVCHSAILDVTYQHYLGRWPVRQRTIA